MAKKHDFEVFTCDCHSMEHMVALEIIDFNDEVSSHANLVSLEFSVLADNYLPWYHRVLCAVKYIFGVPSLHWCSVTMDDEEELLRLRNTIDRAIKIRNDYRSKKD